MDNSCNRGDRNEGGGGDEEKGKREGRGYR
jgi:hypothetical protein